MASSLMKEWRRISDDKYGDFESSGQRHGVIKTSDKEYLIGRFDESDKPDGITLKKKEDGGAIFAKYDHGKPMYPIIDLSKDGVMTVYIEEEKEKVKTLALNLRDSSFRYFYTDKDTKKTLDLGGVNYQSKTNRFSFTDYQNSELSSTKEIEEDFIPLKPIISFQEISFPETVNFNKFDYLSDEGYALCENSTYDEQGIGLIKWEDGNYCISTWLNGKRNGWHIYQFGHYYCIFYGTTQYGGPQVRIYNNPEQDYRIEIFYYSCDENSDDETDTSYELMYNNNSLFFTDMSLDDTLNINPKGKAIRIPSMDRVDFINWTDEDNELFEVERVYKRGLKETPKEIDIPVDENDPERKMMSLIGLNETKKDFIRLLAYLKKNESYDYPINMIFTGGNGVGKSTVAKLITEVLYKYHAIDNADYTEINAKELLNTFTGETDNKIINIYNKAKGGVLLIDDFHYLNTMNSSNVKEGINRIANIMETDHHTTLILVDTKYNMKETIEDNYDILMDKIRFRFDFKDFTREELREILFQKAKEKGYLIEEDALSSLLEVVFLAKTYGNNINASAAISILEEIIVAQNVRTVNSDEKTIIKADVDVYIHANDIAFIDQKTGGQSDARKKLDELVGLDKIKEMVDDLIAYFSINRGKKVDFHMVFTGNPGTGKTEVARIIGKLLRQEGILGSTKFFEVTRRDLIAEYVGQTAVKTRALIDKAMGGVLYIDEAYSLAYGGERDFGAEAIAELLKAMEDRRGEFCVIMSGYTSEMKKLFDLNPGLKSRVKFDLEFPDYSDDEIEKIARLFLKRDNNVMTEDNLNLLVKLVSYQRRLPNFANIRTLREFISKLQIKQARRIRLSQLENINPNELTLEDIINTFGEKEVEAARQLEKVTKVEKLDPKVLMDNSERFKDVKVLDDIDRVSEAIVALKTEGEKPGESTGFIVTKDGYVLTCAHCVNGATHIHARRRIVHRGKNIDIQYEAKLVSIDEKNDVALIKLMSEKDEDFEYVVLDLTNEVKPLEKVHLLGYPFGVSRFDSMSINEGKIASYQKGVNGRPDQINLDIEAKGGNSGSPVLSSDSSRVIGLLCGSSISYHGDLTEEINYSRPISYALKLLEEEYKKES